jgi:fatty-acyl-CoA synthase
MNHAFTLGPALPYMEFRIRDIETGEILPPENEGELFVRGRWLMHSFYKRERHEIFDADGYYGTGDKVFLGHDGHIYFKGRIGGMIKTSGANVSPEEVEIAIRLLPDVVDAAVFGIPDPKLEQKVVAVIVLRNNAKIDESKIIEFLKGQLSSFKIPKLVFFKSLEELPLTPSNKIRKPILMKSICDELGIKI